MASIARSRRLFASTGARLLVVTVLAASPVLLVMLISFVTQRRAVREYAGEQVLLIAHLAAAQQQSLVIQAQQLAAGIASGPEARSDGATCARTLAEQLARTPMLASLGIADLNGNIWCSGRPLSAPVSIADRPYFQEALRTGMPAIGEYQVGRTSGLPSLNVAVPIHDGNRLSGVVFAGIDLRTLVQLVAAANPPPGHTLTVVDRQDTILVRYPEPETWAGRPAPAATIVRDALGLEESGTAEYAGVDGVRRVYGIVRLGGQGQAYAYVTVGIPSEQVYGDLDRALRQGVIASLIGIGLAVVTVLAGVHVVVTRPTNRLLAAARRIGAGDFGVERERQYRGDEFGELEQAVDAMAGTLQARDVALEKQHRLQAEFDQVADLQASVLPEGRHTTAAFDIAARCLPARQVGGDFYDWWEDGSGVLHVVLGDVMGKGMQAAPLMAGARAALRVASQFGRPAAALQAIEPAILRDFEQTGSFITLFYAQIEPARHMLRYADAGHGLGFLIRADGRVERLHPHTVPLGVFAMGNIDETALPLAAGDTLVVASDGLLDEYPALLHNPATVFAALAKTRSAGDLVDALVGPHPLLPGDDDLTVIAVRWMGAPAGGRSTALNRTP